MTATSSHSLRTGSYVRLLSRCTSTHMCSYLFRLPIGIAPVRKCVTQPVTLAHLFQSATIWTSRHLLTHVAPRGTRSWCHLVVPVWVDHGKETKNIVGDTASKRSNISLTSLSPSWKRKKSTLSILTMSTSTRTTTLTDVQMSQRPVIFLRKSQRD